jgi:hypothetical protein
MKFSVIVVLIFLVCIILFCAVYFHDEDPVKGSGNTDNYKNIVNDFRYTPPIVSTKYEQELDLKQPIYGRQIDDQPYNDQPYNDQPYNGQPYDSLYYNDQSYNDQSYNDQPYNGQSFEQKVTKFDEIL